MIAAWLFRVFGSVGLKVAMIGLAVIAVALVLLGARRAGRQAERLDNLERVEKIYRDQLEDAANRPRDRRELRKRLLDGSY